MTDEKPLEEKIKEDVQLTGFPTEIVSASRMLQRAWHVGHNPSFLDEDENKNREFDIWATKDKDVAQFPVNGLLLSICLLAECKKSNYPWVFFTTPEKHYSFILGTVIKWGLHEKQVFSSNHMFVSNSEPIISDIELREFHHYFQKPRLARTFYEAFKGGRKKLNREATGGELESQEATEHIKTIYGAVMSAVKATLFHDKDERKDNWLRIYYPVVIFSGKMFEAQVDSNKRVALLPAKHLQLSFSYKMPVASSKERAGGLSTIWTNYHEFIVDIVHEDYLDEFLQVIEDEQDKLVDILQRKMFSG
jgi:hypothetical protein